MKRTKIQKDNAKIAEIMKARKAAKAIAKAAKKVAVALVILFLTGSGVEAKEMDHTKAVIHHTAGSKETDRDLAVGEIDRYHKEKGWDGIGYHFVIRKDGTVEKGRDINKIGAHAKGRNEYIGIALTGYDNFTHGQISALKNLLRESGVKHIERHHEECPGPELDMDDIRRSL